LGDAGRDAVREVPETRDRYPHSLTIATRWMDNDVYGHVNNVVYYSTQVAPYAGKQYPPDPKAA